MNHRLQTVLLMTVALAGIVFATDSAHAQGRYRPPAGSPLPNALNYFRGDTGVLDPHNAFVEPTRQLNNALNDIQKKQQQANKENMNAIKNLEAESLAAPTGTGSTFFNTLQYFPKPRTRGRR